VTEGTEESTRPVLGIFAPGNPNLSVNDVWGFTVYQGEAFFQLEGGDARGIWRSDGTEAGTRRIKQLDSYPYYDSYIHRTSPVERNGILYFTCRSAAGGPELWKSDGTNDGTQQAVDIVPGSKGSNPQDLTLGDDLIYFSADDGIHGRELWQSDGTPAGTRMVVDLTDGDGLSSSPVGLARTSQKLFFLAKLPGAGADRTLHVMDVE
jgi:ELWxxDGT repeat protein